MSGPLYVNRNHEFVFQGPEGALRKKTPESKIERYPSIDRVENNDWPSSDYAGKNEHLLKSGQLGMCNDPYCTTCPTYYNVKGRQKHSRTSEIFDAKFHNMLNGDAKVILDPLFFFLLNVQQDNKCIVLNWPLTTTLVVLRSMTDFIYVIHILLQFRLAYVAPESTVTGAGDLVDDPKEIARHYFFGYFIIDFLIVLPLPQVTIYPVDPSVAWDSFSMVYITGIPWEHGANYAKNLLRAAILVQYIPRLWRFLPLVAGFSPTGFIFESSWSNFFVNLFTFVLAGHVVGSCWYLFGLQSVNRCFRDACRNSNITRCMEFIDCGHGNDYGDFENNPAWELWKSNENATACFWKDGFDFGIYENAVNLTTHKSLVTKYVYSFFWDSSTLAGNQVPSYFVWEVLFTMAIIGIGLLLFALLIGNMQNFLQALGRRRLEMSLRRRDVEQWMSHRRLPEQLRRQVRDSERFNWAATRGVNEEMLMENLPEDLQRDIRRHLFKFVEKVRIFQLLDEPIIDAICERLRTKTYIKGSKILFRGGLVDKMVFIIRGKMESIGEDQITVPLSEGYACGEELLTWCLEHSSINKDGKRIRIPGHRLLSNRLVRCVTNVEAFVLRAADLEEVTSLFARFLRSPRVQGAIRYESPYWRGIAARRIQVAWRYRKKRMGRADSSSPPHN
ncbi:putative cyclic nucleotide-gated ion channel 20, chloroplastic [Sesamum angolense]|uniref:Cyclic nucleotide-gated ion channel 20, chloroplastic n=1 Tax=Sesamum angolense TaxID=2727404 RepID=A0AAE2BYK1_9LAMI|nr:putative cyclic nucleotide-gated ion channel 20, chloroplastic [Sesamum angolense]